VSVETLPIWVVYDHPADYPDKFVARQHVIGIKGNTPTDRIMAADSLDPIRAALTQAGLVCLDRSEDDDPKIVETWL
jgi:hypothetical protein